MSKANTIRRKALDFAKKREWDKALREYVRLAEIESHNPNVFNELGDLHLKVGHKSAAFAAFHSAVDAYTKVSLFNNAVAVCKKIIRLNPSDYYVYGKLARLRNRQGFKEDAAKYAMNFLDLVCDDESVNPDDLKQQVTEMGEEIGHAPEVLEKIAEYLTKWEFKEEAVAVLDRLAAAYATAGMESKKEEARVRAGELNAVGPPTGETSPTPPVEPEVPLPGAEATGAEAAGLENHRVELDPNKIDVVTATMEEETNEPRPDETGAAVIDDHRATQTDAEESEPPPTDPTVPEPPDTPDVTVEIEARAVNPEPDPPTPPGTPDTAAAAPPSPVAEPPPAAPPDLADDEVWVPSEELPDEFRTGDAEASEVVKVSDIVSQFDARVKADVDVEDYRSHYDLGMAYLEMDLLTEAIREFQFAANSSLYQVRCLEMVGLCFLKQNQARLAIKQLEKGLDLVDEGDHESLGLQYNLGLAYEMDGDDEKARMCFEDVYVVDVAFRDVSEKVKRYTS